MTRLEEFSSLLTTAEGKRIADRLLSQAMTSLRLVSRRGKAKGGGQSSKAKGRAAVVRLRDLIVEKLGIPADAMMVKATSMPGVDLYIAPEHRTKCPFSIEMKCVEALNIWGALAQAQENVDHGVPVVFFKRSGTQMFVALDAETFLEMQAKLNRYEALCQN